MAKSASSGQVVIELAIVTLLMVGVFMLAVSIAEKGREGQKNYRFAKSRGAR